MGCPHLTLAQDFKRGSGRGAGVGVGGGLLIPRHQPGKKESVNFFLSFFL